MNARWLMVMLWALIALALSLLLGGTLFVWLGHLLYRPGSSHASADWLFHVFVVGLPATGGAGMVATFRSDSPSSCQKSSES